MYDIAEQVQDWSAAGREVMVATVVTTRGFSSSSPGSSAAWTPGEPAVGSLVAGLPVAGIEGSGLVDVTVSDADAEAVGLSCGGMLTALVRPATDYPDALWPMLSAREPLCLVDDGAAVTLYTPETIRVAYQAADPVPRLFARGTTAVSMVEDLIVLAFWPVPTLVVVGDGLIADALASAAALLEWTPHVTADVDAAVTAVSGLHGSDAVLVLSHDRAVDGPALAAALAGRCGYVGALGSRRTQAARREWLTAYGVPDADQDRVHGPAGLDIDAHTPGEIAVSVVAEIIAARSGSSGGALRDRPGSVHGAGVHAPPPRY